MADGGRMVRLGRTNLQVPVCSFGGIPVGRDHLTDKEGADIIRRAVDSGLTLIDTFCNYGRSEERIGMALRDGGRRDKVTLVTKSRGNFEPAEFRAMIEASLQALQVECIDVLLIKNIDNVESLHKVEANVEVLNRFKEQGKVRFTGLSSHSPGNACAALETGLLDVAEVPHNYANRHFEPVLELAAERDLGILAMKPLGGGRLFEEMEKGTPATLDTLVQALSFAMSHRADPVLIPGIGTELELDRYLEARPLLRHLDEAEKDALTEKALDFGTDFCRGCGYCTAVCPGGMPIDEILPLLDRHKHVRTDGTYQKQLKDCFRELDASLDRCEGCGRCVEECPYNLPVTERLKEAFEILRSD